MFGSLFNSTFEYNDTNTTNFNQLTGVQDDNCTINTRIKQSENVGDYATYNNYQFQNIGNSVNIATNERTMTFRDGYSASANIIDIESNLRNNQIQTNPRYRLNAQLKERPYKTVPYMGRGRGNQYLESALQQGKFVREKSFCGGNISEKTFDQVFTPQIEHLQRNIQNPHNLVQEVADPTWVRGGIPSRLVMRDNSEDCKYR